MKRILLLISLIIALLYAGVGFAHSGFRYGIVDFEGFMPSSDGTRYPDGLYAQNFDKKNGGAGIYSETGFDGKCAVIKSTSTRGYTQMAYRYGTETKETTCFSFDILIKDTALKRAVQIRFGASTETGVDALVFEPDKNVMLGTGYISGLEWECGRWYHTELTVNPVSGKVSVVITDGEEIYKSRGNLGKTGSIYSFWLTNNGKADALTCTDNWSVKSVIEPLDVEYYDNFNSFSKSIISGAEGCNAGAWIKPVGSGMVTYEPSEESGNTSLKMTTVSTTNAQNLEYVSRNSGYTGTIGYDLSLKLDDFNTEKRFIIRDSFKNTLVLGAIDKTGNLYWCGENSFYRLSPEKWYDFKITYNTDSGYAEVKVSDGENQKSFSDFTELRSNVRYTGIANMAYSTSENHGVKSVIYIDNFTLYQKNTGTYPFEDKRNINGMENVSDFDTTGTGTYLNTERVLKLTPGEYIKIPGGDKKTVTADVFMKSPCEAKIKVGDETVLKLSGENVYREDDIIGKISVWNWYKICVTIDSEKKYITLSKDGKLIASVKAAGGEDRDVTVVSDMGGLYLDNCGTFDSGKNISYFYASPENAETKNTSFIEIVFPYFLDKESFNIYLNEKPANVRFLGDKTVRIDNLEPDSYYNVSIENARDLYGNFINAKIEFETGPEMVGVNFDNTISEDGKVNATVKVN